MKDKIFSSFDEAVADIFENFAREIFVHRFDFLQQYHIGFRLGDPCRDGVDAGLDAVDVVSGNFHELLTVECGFVTL